jgi:hypothetical protein
VLKGGRRLPEKAALLTWSRRLNLVRCLLVVRKRA